MRLITITSYVKAKIYLPQCRRQALGLVTNCDGVDAPGQMVVVASGVV